jgi:hypothetical protein
MKASELIELLQGTIARVGDLEVFDVDGREVTDVSDDHFIDHFIVIESEV